MIKKIIIFLFLGISLLSVDGKPTFSKDSLWVVDLRNSNFREGEILKLDGYWQFFWNEFVPLDSIDSNKNYTLIDINRFWNRQKGGLKDIPPNGYATYRLKLLLPKNAPVLGLYIKEIQCAFKCYVNRELLVSGGKIGVSKDEEQPDLVSKPLPLNLLSDTLDLVFYISNFSHRNGGFFKPPEIASFKSMTRSRLYQVFLDIFLFSSLLILGLYHVYLYVTQQNNRAFLWFGIFSLVFSIRTIVGGTELLKNLYPSLDWFFIYRLKYLSVYLAIFSFARYVYFLRKDILNRKIYYAFSSIVFVYVLSIALSPSIFTSLLPSFFVFVFLGISYLLYEFIKNKGKSVNQSRVLLISILVLFIAGLHDTLVTQKIGVSQYYMPYATLLFVFGQADVLSKEMKRSFLRVKELSEKLEFQNQHLESLVEKRHHSILENYNLIIKANEDLQKKQKIILRQRELLKQRQRRLNNTLNFMPEMLFECDLEGRLIMANNKFFEVTGLTRRHFKEGINIFKLLFGENYSTVIEQLNVDKSIRNEVISLKIGQLDIIISVSIAALQNDSLFKGYRGIIIDVTAQEQLRKQMYKLHMAVQQSANAVIMCDLSGKIEFVNDKFLELSNLNSQEILGEDIEKLGTKDIGTEFYTELWTVLLAGKVWVGNLKYTRKGQKDLIIHVNFSPMYDDYNRVNGFMAIMEDTTKSVNAELERIEILNELTVRENELTQSLTYARILQNAILSSESLFEEYFANYFIINKPLDIVSGDFYFVKKVKDKIILAVADSTGHGIPGAIMSVLGISFLNEILQNREDIYVSEILNLMRKKIIGILSQGKSHVAKDGIDMSLCSIDLNNKTIEFSGANRPIIVVSDGAIVRLSPVKQALGVNYRSEDFVSHRMMYNKSCSIYLFSDGFTDQFGGERSKKYGRNRLLKLISRVQNYSFSHQKKLIHSEFENWRGEEKQIDDMLFVGIKL